MAGESRATLEERRSAERERSGRGDRAERRQSSMSGGLWVRCAAEGRGEESRREAAFRRRTSCTILAIREGEVEREEEGSLFGRMCDGGGATEGAKEGDVGTAMAGAAADGGAEGAIAGPCAWDRRVRMSSCAAASSRRRRSSCAAASSLRRRSISSVRTEKRSSAGAMGRAGGWGAGVPAEGGGGGSGAPGSVEAGEGASHVVLGSTEEEADGPGEEDLSLRKACRVRRRRRRALDTPGCVDV